MKEQQAVEGSGPSAQTFEGVQAVAAAQAVAGHGRPRTRFLLAALVVLAVVQLAIAPAARADQGSAFVQTNLVSDLPNRARVQDLNLKNPWGISHGPTTPWWVSDNAAGVATVYDGTGTPFPPGNPKVVNIPAPGAMTGGAPTGNVFNGNPADFVVSDGKTSGSSVFIFATEDGTIVGWSPAVSPTQAFIAVDNSQVPDAADGAVYKGLTLASTQHGQLLYAANFRAGTVDVFNRAFKPVSLRDAFVDTQIPADFAPFGIRAIGDRIFVTYAKQNGARHDDVAGPGNGFVDVFSTEGQLLHRLIRHGQLDSPWGLTVAPGGFGQFGGDLLVGNFGDGRINAYKVESGNFDGTMRRPDGTPIVIDGLWGLAFGNGSSAGPEATLFFAAGINGEKDGLFGTILPASKPEP
jgi:uncharacterized protein (TIGR03118 family)